MDRNHQHSVFTALRGKLLTLAFVFFAAAGISGCDTPANDVTAPKIVAGAAHACAFDADREQVVCWGDNSYGQLGNEEFSAEGVSAPVRVKVISGRKIKSLSAGYSHTCALVSGGDDDSKNTVACWGYNHYGQVGNGTFNDSNVPVFVNGPDGKPLTGVVNLSAGAYHTCASIVKGSASDPSNYIATTYCWGRNDKGQIGNGALTNVNVPTEIKGLDYSGGVAAGTAHTCALTSKSTEDAQAKKYVVMCWGDASRGQMREATVEGGYSVAPVDIGLPLQGDDDGFPALFSEHVVQADVTTATGKRVEGEEALAAAPETPAYGQTCAITADQVLCWGGTNQNGQWGTAATDVTEFAVKTEEIVSGSTLKAYGAGNAQSCMLVGKGDDSSANEVACWGYSSSLGFGLPADATDAVVATNRQVVTLQGQRPTGLAVGREFVCYAAKGEQPQIWCWGTGKKGQIGNASIVSTRVPQCVKGYCPETKASENLVDGQPFEEAPGAPPTVLQISAGGDRTCAVVAGGDIYCWGESFEGVYKDRDGSYPSTKANSLPQKIDEALDGVPLSVATGPYQMCAILFGGKLTCWGVAYRPHSFMGMGEQEAEVGNYMAPYVRPELATGVKEVAVAGNEICALKNDNNLFCLHGPNNPPHVAGTSVKSVAMSASMLESPCVLKQGGKSVECLGIEIMSGETYSSISGSAMGLCAVVTDGRVRCHGMLWRGEKYLPGMSDALQVALGVDICVLRKTGGVKCFPIGESTEPYEPFGLQFGVLSISGGYSHTCALVIGGVVKCWGHNDYGQLGDGTTRRGYSPFPVEVSFGAKVRGETAVKTVNAEEGQNQQKVTVTIPTASGDLAYGFDCDNDGAYEINGDVAGHECFYGKLASGSYEIGYEITAKGLFDEVKTTGKVGFTVQNLPPVISAVTHDDAVVVAGSNAAKNFTIASVTASDPGGDALTYGYDCNRDGVVADDEKQAATLAVCDLSALTPGTYSLPVFVTDADHETQGKGQTIKPITITIVPPAEAQIDSAPPEYSNATTAVFTFSSPQTDTIEYKLNNAAFALTTTGTASFTALTDGTHTFYARAVSGGFAGVATSYAWVVDTVAPGTVSNTSFAEPVSVDTVVISFSATDENAAGGFTYLCRLDGGAWEACTPGQSFGPVTTEGTHTVIVAATDAAGNATTMPTTITWQYIIPAVTVNPGSGPAEGTTVASDAATFTWGGTGTFQCQLDGGAWEPCTSPANLTNLDDGSHTFSVREVRNGVPASTASTRTWTVDTTPPDTTISNSYANDASGTSFSVEFSCGETGCSFECRVDSGSYATCTSPFTASVATEGLHTAYVRAYDDIGNVDLSPASVTWTTTFPTGGGGDPGSPSAVTSVAVGTQHSCVVTGNGELYCWGDNILGQLGDPAAAGSTPSRIGTDTWKKIAADGNADHTCGIQTDDTLWCWGPNMFGQLGDGTNNLAAIPMQIGTSTWRDVSAGSFHTCGIQTDGTLWCWGDNFSGAVGNGAGGEQTTPAQIGTATNWVSVGLGGGHSCAINSSGELYCWGGDYSDQVGNGSTTTDVPAPQKIGTDTDWAQVDGGYVHTCALKTGGQLYCWGSGEFDNQTGDGANHDVPSQVGADSDWAFLSTGGTHSCAIKTTGALWCWGGNGHGQLGNGDDSGMPAAPAQIGTATNWLTVGGGHQHSIAIADVAGTDTVYGWGSNEMGQVGDPNASPDAMTPAYAPYELTLP